MSGMTERRGRVFGGLGEALRGFLRAEQVRFDEPMARHTTFRIGGPADCLALPSSTEEFLRILMLARRYGVPVTVIGNGSNLLVRDGGIRGLVVSFGKPFSYIERTEEGLRAGAGASLGAASLFAAERALAGLEFAVGIPGSVGGAVFMNAGAYDGEMKAVVRAVTAVTPAGEAVRLEADALGFGYRRSAFQENGYVICEAELALAPGDGAAIREKMADFTRRRVEKQPVELPSAGSTFRRPPGFFAGTLIERSGLKGFAVGGARVSEKHAGFIVSDGTATAADVLALMDEVRRRVYERHGVRLEPEVRVLGEA